MSSIKPESETDSVAMDVSPMATFAADSTPAPDPTADPIPVSTQDTPLTPSESMPSSIPLSITASPSILPSSPISHIQHPVAPPTPTREQSIINSSVNGTRNNSNTSSTRLTNGPTTTSALDRGPLGLTIEEEQWVKEKMEYALYDFQVLSLAIKRYKWQLNQVPKDVSRLQSLKEKHIEEPFEFLRQLKSKEFRYPESQRTLPAPSIEWTKYQFPPANPVIPTKTPRATYLSSVSFTTNRDRSSANVVSLASRSSNNNRSRAGSPSYERMRTVKDTAKSLGIHTVHHHYPIHHHQHVNSHDFEVDTNRIESNGAGERLSSETREPSQQASQEIGQSGAGRSSSPVANVGSHDMEGVTYSGQVAQSASFRVESTPAAQFGVTPYSSTQQSQVSNDQAAFESTNLTIDHSLGYNPIQPSDFGTNSNITYNHMSGSVDVQPGNNVKPRGSSREGSGVRDDPKPPLYNIPWSDEEQQLLERLLEEYPDEPVAAQRFQKISAAMGTRTPKQVASRVQKYFIKLVKAGLEAPGRMNYSLETSKAKGKGVSTTAKGKKRKEGPGGSGGVGGTEGMASGKAKAARPPKKKELSVEAAGIGGRPSGSVLGSGIGSGSGMKKKQKAKSLLGSGFGRTSGTQYLHYSSAPTVYMSDEDDEESVQDMLGVSSGNINNGGNIHGGNSQRGSPDGGIATHIGYSCDSCGVEPILGIRYSCMDCEELGGTDLCGPCYNSGEYQNELHILSHRFQAIETADIPAYSHDYRSSSAGPSGTSGIHHIG
ncbi:ZZ-type zinc finger-containing protein 3 [Mortierella sp. AM989]|nr:ZZ-type zinc finger-containing protein 3 [Mortierella sp. AM989]